MSSTVYPTSHPVDQLWDDLRFPVGNLTQPVAGRPDWEAGTGMALYDAAQTEVAYGIAQMPHAWREQSVVRPHIHWQPTSTNTGNVYWRLEYQVHPASGGDAWDWSTGWTTVNILDAGNGVAHVTQIASFGDVDMTGFLISALIPFRLSRIGGDGTDTYTADARLLEFDIHYQSDSLGSRSLFNK